MGAWDDDPRVWVAVLLGGWLLLVLLRSWWRTLVKRLRHHARSRRAYAGEADAERLLQRHGFAITERQASRTYDIRLDDQPLQITLRADYLVERAGRMLVAEVKTGDSAPDLRTAATRRQLLEYLLAYDVDGVLLVDMEGGRLHEVHFPLID